MAPQNLGGRRAVAMRSPGASRLAVLLVAAVLAVAGCGDGGDAESPPTLDGAITVASFNFAESRILAELYAQAFEEAGYPVSRALGMASREVVEPALVQGLVDFVPEYAGTALEFLNQGAGEASADPAATHSRLVDAFATRGVAVLDYAAAENRNGIAVRRDTAERFGLETISDLAAVDDQLVFGGPPECPERPLCLPGLERVYGLDFADFVALDAGGPLTVAALAGREIDVGLLFTSDPNVASNNFLLLEDDQGLQPAENVVPVVRQEMIDRFGQDFVARVDAVTAALTTDEVSDLVGRARDGETEAELAAEWLDDHDLD
jgi:osmoprotectant transport system substrate-binding protein